MFHDTSEDSYLHTACHHKSKSQFSKCYSQRDRQTIKSRRYVLQAENGLDTVTYLAENEHISLYVLHFSQSCVSQNRGLLDNECQVMWARVEYEKWK
jgi:hypothetical protein